MRLNRKTSAVKSAFTLVEVMAVVVIIGLISAFSYQSYQTSLKNQRVDSAEADLRAFNQSFGSYFIDYGNIEISDALSDSAYREKIDEIIGILNRQYLPSEIQFDRVIAGNKGFKCTTKLKKDPWDQLYDIYINTKASAGAPAGIVVVTSKGPDRETQFDTYSDNNYGDDILVIIEPKAS